MYKIPQYEDKPLTEKEKYMAKYSETIALMEEGSPEQLKKFLDNKFPDKDMTEHEFKYTQCIIVRSDLKMGKGKVGAQVAHASVGAVREADPDIVEAWFKEGQRKIVLKIVNESWLRAMYASAAHPNFNIPAYLVEDFGLTTFNGVKTVTCLGLGPCEKEHMDAFTAGLKLY